MTRSRMFETLESRVHLAATPTPVGTYDFGDVAGKNTKFIFVDADGTRSTFALTGGGTGHIAWTGVARDVTIEGTSRNSNLSISAGGGDGRLGLSNINSATPLGKIVAPGIDIFDNVTLAGPVRILTLGDIDHTHTITIGAGETGDTATVTFRDVVDTNLTSAIPLKSLTAKKWTVFDSPSAGAINAPSLGTLKIAGDFGADVLVETLGNATVGGIWSGTTSISGNAGNLKAKQLRGSLTVAGNVRGIQTGDFLALSQVASATGGSIHLASATKVKGLGETLTVGAGGATVFTATAEMYTPQELLQFNDLGSVRTFDQTTIDSDGTTTGLSTDSVRPATEIVDGRVSFVTDNVEGQDTNVETWFEDVNGVYQTNVASATQDPDGAQNLTLNLGLLRVAPSVLTLKRASSDAQAITANLQLVADNISADLAGTAQITTTLIGHESVTVPAGTFLAAKVITTRKLRVTGPATTPEGTLNLALDVTVKTTLWMVPGTGIVKEFNESTLQVSAPGLPRQVSKSKSTRVLSAP